MTFLSYYTTSTKNEFIKLKRTFAFWLTIISALFIPVIYFLFYFFKHEKLVPAEGINPWDEFLIQQIKAAIPLLVPMFIVLVTSLIVQIEHKSSSIKHLFALPITKSSVYFGKLTVVVFTILIAYTLFFFFMLVSGCFVGAIHNDLQLLAFTPNIKESVKLLFTSYIAILGVVGLQFWLSFRVKNFIIPLGIGLVLVVTGLIVYKAEEAVYFPYAYNILGLSFKEEVLFTKVSLYSIAYFLIFSIIGYLDVRRLNVK